MDVFVAPDAEQVAKVAAASLAVALRNAIRRRGTASLALSGGSTPAMMVAELATMDLDWDAVCVFQVDERIAPDGDPDRNLSQLLALPLPARNLIRMPVTAADLSRACRRYAERLPDRLDVVHLGLGADGHTASWPPGDAVADADALVAISSEYQGRRRMTVTPRVVNTARRRVVVVTGAAKAAVVSQWLLENASLPIQRVRRSGTTLWLDEEAAAALPQPG